MHEGPGVGQVEDEVRGVRLLLRGVELEVWAPSGVLVKRVQYQREATADFVRRWIGYAIQYAKGVEDWEIRDWEDLERKAFLAFVRQRGVM